MHLGEQNSRAMSVGQVDLFGLAAAENAAVADWTDAQRLAGERETLGLFLSGHPITPYEPDLKFLVSARLKDVGGGKPAAPTGERGWSQGKPATVAGLVLEIRRRPNRVTLILDDRSARLEVSLFEETFQQYRDIIVKDAILIVDGMLRFDDFIEAWRLQAKTLMDIDRARERFAAADLEHQAGDGRGLARLQLRVPSAPPACRPHPPAARSPGISNPARRA